MLSPFSGSLCTIDICLRRLEDVGSVDVLGKGTVKFIIALQRLYSFALQAPSRRSARSVHTRFRCLTNTYSVIRLFWSAQLRPAYCRAVISHVWTTRTTVTLVET